MEKRISYSQFQSVKSVAKACDPLMVKKAKLKAKLDAIYEEYNNLDAQVSALEAGIFQIIGFHVNDLVKKVIETSQDKNGKEVKTTKYLPTDIVSYDKDNKQFIIKVPEDVSLETQESTEVESSVSE
nr:MAG TPA: hypothetical protein [Caudoviricetes sp.]